MSGGRVHLYFTDSGQDVQSGESVLVITEELRKRRKSTNQNWYSRLADMNVDSSGFLTYKLLWPYLLRSDRGKLCIYAEVYRCIEDYFKEGSPSEVVTHDLERGYQLTVEEVCDEYGIATRHSTDEQLLEPMLPALLIRFSVLLLFADQFLSLLTRAIKPPEPSRQNAPLFFPYPGRFGSMLPVIRELEKPSNVVVTPLTISWRFFGTNQEWPSTVGSSTLSEYTDISTMWKQVKTLLQLQKSLLTGDLSISKNVSKELYSEYGIKMPKTVHHVCKSIIREKTRQILTLHLIERSIEKTAPESVIVGGMAPRDRHAIQIAERKGASTFYIPHSIAYGDEVIPPSTNTTHIVSGSADVRKLKDIYSQRQLPRVCPAGRPYLDSLRRGSSVGKGNGDSRIILGTQPYPDWIREEFVQNVLAALDEIGYENEVLVKIHPSEHKSYYHKQIYEEKFEFDVRIKTGPLKDYVNNSTFLITINSNVGIESILLGGSCLSYNPCEPFVLPSSYIDGEIVPYATDKFELVEMLKSTIDVGKNDEQMSYILESYSIGGSKERVANILMDPS